MLFVYEVVCKGSVRYIKRVLKLGESIDKFLLFWEDGLVMFLLFVVVFNLCWVVWFLVENGVDVNGKDRGRRGVFYYVVMGGNKDIVLYFFCLGVFVDCKLIWGKSVLYMVVGNGYVEIVDIFI